MWFLNYTINWAKWINFIYHCSSNSIPNKLNDKNIIVFGIIVLKTKQSILIEGTKIIYLFIYFLHILSIWNKFEFIVN